MNYDFRQWIPLLDLSAGRLPKYGAFAAVYCLREKESREILKYGCTGNLRRRILGNYFGGIGGKTTQRIHAKLFGKQKMIGVVQIAWIRTRDAKKAKLRESECRRCYKNIYGKRPKWDRQD